MGIIVVALPEPLWGLNEENVKGLLVQGLVYHKYTNVIFLVKNKSNPNVGLLLINI